MTLTNIAKTNFFKMVFGQTANNLLLPTCYLALSSTAPNTDGTGFTEPSGNGYARALLGDTTLPSSWLMATTQDFSENNTNIIYFPEATLAWGTMTHWGLFTTASGGDLLVYGDLSAPVNVSAHFVPIFRLGAFVVSIVDGSPTQSGSEITLP